MFDLESQSVRKLTAEEAKKLEEEKVTISEFKSNKLESDAKKNWDLFYKRNGDRFFKDRHWTTREFDELTDDSLVLDDKPVLFEIGCGVGNFIFPLIGAETKFFIQACDFSPRAIQIVKDNELYKPEVCNAFICDVTCEDLQLFIEQDSIAVATMIFVLSAIHPQKMLFTLKNIYKVLKPGGLLLLRDYGLHDHAMLRFGPGHKLDDYFYVRQDGTRAFYFSEDKLSSLLQDAGFEVISNNYVLRETINRKENICVQRVYVQGKYRKPR